MMCDFENLVDGLNKSQTEAVLNPVNSCTKIVAGAGTGKTKIISKRFAKLVMELLANGVENPESKILVITFTDKAANEMRERIVLELENNQISSSNILENDLWISTFHSFCIRILKKHSIEVGLSPSFKILEEQQLKEIYDNIIKRVKYGEVFDLNEITKLSEIDDLDILFENIYSIIKKIKSLGITAEEFQKKSIQSLKIFSSHLEKTPFKFETKEEYVDAWANHFREYKDDYCIFDEKLFDAIAKEKLILDKNGKRNAIEYGMAQGFPENIQPFCDIEILLTKTIAQIYDIYQNELLKEDVLDFDDLINKTIQIFKENSQIREYYQQYFKQIIVDEFQDTNGAQLELIELLLNPDYPNLTFVGDRKQSIYAFRYAQMENLEVLQKNVEKKYNQKFKPINLSINYRSTPEVLNAVNYVTENELLLSNESLCANPNLTYPDTSEDIKVTVINDFENANEQKICEASYIAKEILMLLNRDNANYKDFAILVKSHAQADIIENELKKYDIPSIKKVNTNFFQLPLVKNFLAALRLIRNFEDEQAFFRLLEVNYSKSVLYKFKRFIDEKLIEKLSFEETKKMNFAQKVLFLLANEEHIEDSFGVDVFDSVKNIYKVVNDIRKNKNSLTLLQIFEILKSQITLYILKDGNKQNDLDFEKSQIFNNFLILEKIIAEYSQCEMNVSVNSFLKYFEKIAEDKNYELPTVLVGEVNAVSILTIHASKGLEFPYVFVLSISTAGKNPDKSNIIFDMQYGDKPGFGIIVKKYQGKTNPKVLIYKTFWQKIREENEALRLFYVAVSRAKKYLNVLSFEPYTSVKPAEYIDNLACHLNH